MIRIVFPLLILLLIGLILGTSLLVFSAYVLFAVITLSRYFANRWASSIQGERSISKTELEIGESTTIGVRLKNSSRLFVPWMLTEDVLRKRDIHSPHPGLETEGPSIRLCTLGANTQRLLPYRLKAKRRGYFQIGPTVGETGDLFGLHRQYRVFCKPTYLTVLPKIVPLAGYAIESRRPVGENQVTYKMMEDPTLISGIRRYQIGDPLSRVHWRATARTGQLHSKTFQPTSVAGAMLVLDLHTKSNPQAHEPVRSDLAVTAAASICHTLYQMQQQFGIVSNGRDAADKIREAGWIADFRSRQEALQHARKVTIEQRKRPVVIPAGRGPEHFRSTHQSLARLQLSDGLELPEMLIETQAKLPRDASVIVIVQDVSYQNALALGMLRRQGYAVSAIVNHYEEEATLTAAGRLMAEHIPVFHLKDEDSIRDICRNMLMKG